MIVIINTSFHVPHKKYNMFQIWQKKEARIPCLLFCYQKHSLNSAENSENCYKDMWCGCTPHYAFIWHIRWEWYVQNL